MNLRLNFVVAELLPLLDWAESNPPSTLFQDLLDPNMWKEGTVPEVGKFFTDPIATQDDIDESKIPPHLLFVKDEGIYLMAGTKNRQPGPDPEDARCAVAYAEGYGPGIHVSGDDFGERIGCGEIRSMIAGHEPDAALRIDMTETSFMITVEDRS